MCRVAAPGAGGWRSSQRAPAARAAAHDMRLSLHERAMENTLRSAPDDFLGRT